MTETFQPSTQIDLIPQPVGAPEPPKTLAFGNHNGAFGLIDGTGDLFFMDPLRRCGPVNGTPWRQVTHIAIRGDGTVAVIEKVGEQHCDHKILEFPTFRATGTAGSDPNPVPASRGPSFLEHYYSTLHQQPFTPINSPPMPQSIHPLSAEQKPVDLLANNAGFTLLTSNGEVYTWGDERFPECLGRDVTPGTSPARKPYIVEELTGLGVKKIVSRGWSSGCITQGGECYFWGGRPGRSDDWRGGEGHVVESILGLPPMSGAEVEDTHVVKMAAIDVVGREIHAADVALGNNHALIVREGERELWGIGSNAYGQMPFSPTRLSAQLFFNKWIQVVQAMGDERISEVAAGDETTFFTKGRPMTI